ncbi:MAG: L-threonylcarbamoyladenylate synthase [candidate division Zixibacteria bacterium]|nr:L-threonylcarbamoyladenylate synthase [candidate division Zixibacteria bacterium]
MIKTEILKVSTEEQNRQAILRAAEIVKKGGIISFPTETVYALGADAMNKQAVERIFQIKARETDKPFAIFVPDYTSLNEFVENISFYAEKLMGEFWPGPLTLIFKSKPGKLAHLTGGKNKLGFRVSSAEPVQLLLAEIKGPLTATSANLSGFRESVSAEDVYKQFKEKIELILDGGQSNEPIPSSVVDVSGDIPILIREGRISIDEFKRVVPRIKII